MDLSNPHANPTPEVRRRLERLKSGCALLSREALNDPNFSMTIILMCIHNKDGSYGLVLNRPSHMPLSELLPGVGRTAQTKRVCIGGPVRQDELQILHLSDAPAPGAYSIAPRVHMGGNWENLAETITSDNDEYRLFLGYSGWGPGQLEFEVIAGAWEVYNVDAEQLLARIDVERRSTVDEMDRFLRSLEANPRSR